MAAADFACAIAAAVVDEDDLEIGISQRLEGSEEVLERVGGVVRAHDD